MKWIGLTGGMGSGKSSVTGLLRSRGWPVVDADQLARDVVQVGRPGLEQIRQAFGPAVFKADGSLDRAQMAEQVFARPEELRRLELILHPLIQQEVKILRQQALAAGHQMAFYDVPLLFEKKLQSQFDAVVLVWSTEEQQIQRSVQRGGVTAKDVEKRLQQQIPLSQKKALSDIVIDNSGPPEALAAQVDQAILQLQQLK